MAMAMPVKNVTHGIHYNQIDEEHGREKNRLVTNLKIIHWKGKLKESKFLFFFGLYYRLKKKKKLVM